MIRNPWARAAGIILITTIRWLGAKTWCQLIDCDHTWRKFPDGTLERRCRRCERLTNRVVPIRPGSRA